MTTLISPTWTAGDFGRIAAGFADGAAAFVDRLDLAPGERVLDVACGTGNVAIPAARAGAAVTGIDLAPNLLAQAATWAGREGLDVTLDEGNCERMPYDDAGFDTVVSMFGAMFTPRPERAALELLRVCRPGGCVAMANWTAGGLIGEMLKVTTAYVPPPAGAPSPLLWGSPTVVRERLRDARAVRVAERAMRLEFPLAPAGVVDLFRHSDGPTVRAFAALDADGRVALRHDLIRLWTTHNLARDGTTRAESTFLEVIAIA